MAGVALGAVGLERMEANRPAVRCLPELGRLSGHKLAHVTLSSLLLLPLSFPPFFFPQYCQIPGIKWYTGQHLSETQSRGRARSKGRNGKCRVENSRASNREVWALIQTIGTARSRRRSLEFPQQMEHICKATIAGLTGRESCGCSRFNSHWIWEKDSRVKGSGFLVPLAELSVAWLLC